MKTSLASRRTAVAVLAVSITVVSAGCSSGGSPGPVTPTATATSSRIPLATAKPQTGGRASSLAAYLPSLITCFKAHGVAVTSQSTGKQVRQAFRALPLASQERVFTTCGHLLPVSARQVIANDLITEKGLTK